jgi:hypothetical protein
MKKWCPFHVLFLDLCQTYPISHFMHRNASAVHMDFCHVLCQQHIQIKLHLRQPKQNSPACSRRSKSILTIPKSTSSKNNTHATQLYCWVATRVTHIILLAQLGEPSLIVPNHHKCQSWFICIHCNLLFTECRVQLIADTPQNITAHVDKLHCLGVFGTLLISLWPTLLGYG